MAYLTPTSSAQTEISIKKSRFISYARPVLSRADALCLLAELREQYPDARHICWGYVIGDPNNSTNAGCSDDGEPSGTAGKPILAQINYANTGNVIVAVVRYFGGVRLGAGGLVRAYREAAQSVLNHLTTVEFVPQINAQIRCQFADESQVRQLVHQVDGHILAVTYGQDVRLDLTLSKAVLANLQAQLIPLNAQLLSAKRDAD